MTRYLTLLDRLKDKQMPDRRGGDKFQFFEKFTNLIFLIKIPLFCFSLF